MLTSPLPKPSPSEAAVDATAPTLVVTVDTVFVGVPVTGSTIGPVFWVRYSVLTPIH